jgi:hypothetical protein
MWTCLTAFRVHLFQLTMTSEKELFPQCSADPFYSINQIRSGCLEPKYQISVFAEDNWNWYSMAVCYPPMLVREVDSEQAVSSDTLHQ